MKGPFACPGCGERLVTLYSKGYTPSKNVVECRGCGTTYKVILTRI